MRTLDKPLPPPIEYYRADVRRDDVFNEIPEASFLVLGSYICSSIKKSELNKDITKNLSTAWHQLTYELIVNGGFCNSQGYEALCMLRVADVLPALKNPFSIALPRVNATCWVAVPEAVSLAVYKYLSIMRRKFKLEGFRDLPPDFLLVPFALNPHGQCTQDEMAQSKKRFSIWLEHQVTQSKCKAPIRMKHLFGYGVHRTNALRNNYVTGYVIGTHILDPIGIEQANILEKLRINWEDAGKDENISASLVRRTNTANRIPMPDNEIEAAFIRTIKALLATTERESSQFSAQKRVEIKGDLSIIRSQILKTIKNSPNTVEEALAEIEQDLTIEKMSMINLLLLVDWMEGLLNESPATFVAYTRDILLIVQDIDKLLPRLTMEDIAEQIEMYAVSTQSRKIGSINNLHNYLENRYRLNFSFPFINFDAPPTICTAYVLTMGQVRAIVEHFSQQDDEGQSVAMSILQAAFWGLRITETFNLSADQILIDHNGAISIHILKTKNAYKRDVVESKVPDPVKRFILSFLQSIPQNRRALPMLKVKSPKLTMRRLRYLIDTGMKTQGLPGTHHIFRHFFINRLLALGYSLQELADLAHHRSGDTTVSSYTHIAPAIMIEKQEAYQAEQRAKDDCDDQFIRISQLGPLRGCSDRADQRSDLIRRGIEIYAHKPGKGYFSSANGYYVRIRDAIRYLLEKVW